jgi:hypothetical protein
MTKEACIEVCTDCGAVVDLDEMERDLKRDTRRCEKCSHRYYNRISIRLLGAVHMAWDFVFAS